MHRWIIPLKLERARSTMGLLLQCLLLTQLLLNSAYGQFPTRPTPAPKHPDFGHQVLKPGMHPFQQPDWSTAKQVGNYWCVFKTEQVRKHEKDLVKECWHQNVRTCHHTHVTVYKSHQVKKCDDNTFWKTCKITFKEVALDHTVRTCHTPLERKCHEVTPSNPARTVCKTWYESVCNTTFNSEDGKKKHQTWCEKMPKTICGPDNCDMVPGTPQCHDLVVHSTIYRPEEVCDLQPAVDCHVVTDMVPHLEQHEECSLIPKEFCHSKLDHPQEVTKNITKKWCINGAQYRQWQQGLTPAQFSNPILDPNDDLLGDIGDLAGIAINAQNPGNGGFAGLAIQPAIQPPNIITKREMNEETQKQRNSSSLVDLVLTPISVPTEPSSTAQPKNTNDKPEIHNYVS